MLIPLESVDSMSVERRDQEENGHGRKSVAR
jgi:hypothetical protein